MTFLVTLAFVLIYSFQRNEIQCRSQNSIFTVQNALPHQVKKNPPHQIFQSQIKTLADASQSSDRWRRITSANNETSNRRSKFFGSLLGFLTGLEISGFTPAALTSVNSFANTPLGSIAFNLGPAGLFAALYNPYSLLTFPYAHPYPFPSPRPVQNPGELQQGGPMELQSPISQQIVTMLDSTTSAPTTASIKEEEYIDGNITSTNNKGSMNNQESGNIVEEKERKTVDISTKERNETLPTQAVELEAEEQKVHEKSTKGPPIKEEEEEEEEEEEDYISDDPQATMQKVDIATTTQKAINNRNNTDSKPTMMTQTNTTNRDNSTMMEKPQFFGYYNGSPQNITHIDFTTEKSSLRYHDYNEVNFNLPFERPANFNPNSPHEKPTDFRYEDRYEIYGGSPSNSFSPTDKSPEYLSTVDFNRFAYAMFNPQNLNGFRPIA